MYINTQNIDSTKDIELMKKWTKTTNRNLDYIYDTVREILKNINPIYERTLKGEKEFTNEENEFIYYSNEKLEHASNEISDFFVRRRINFNKFNESSIEEIFSPFYDVVWEMELLHSMPRTIKSDLLFSRHEISNAEAIKINLGIENDKNVLINSHLYDFYFKMAFSQQFSQIELIKFKYETITSQLRYWKNGPKDIEKTVENISDFTPKQHKKIAFELSKGKAKNKIGKFREFWYEKDGKGNILVKNNYWDDTLFKEFKWIFLYLKKVRNLMEHSFSPIGLALNIGDQYGSYEGNPYNDIYQLNKIMTCINFVYLYHLDKMLKSEIIDNNLIEKWELELIYLNSNDLDESEEARFQLLKLGAPECLYIKRTDLI